MRLAFVFPGQGSQSVGMLNGFAGNAAVQAVLDRADAALQMPISQMIAEGPEADLGLTVNTQPALLTTEMAFWSAWMAKKGPMPEVMAGHSLGEYVALTAAGVFTLEDAVQLVRFRAQAMQSAVPVGVGGMAAVLGLDDQAVVDVCAQASALGPVEAVNFNSPGQVVIAGQKAALEKACELAKEKGAMRCMVLPVSAPFHSSMLKPAAEQLAQRLRQTPMNAPQIPVIANVDVSTHETVEGIRHLLPLQAASAVQWVKTIEAMKARGITHLVECGPGKVLAGLIRRIDRNLKVVNFSDEASLDAAIETITQAAAA